MKNYFDGTSRGRGCVDLTIGRSAKGVHAKGTSTNRQRKPALTPAGQSGSKYHIVKDGEGVSFVSGEVFKFACCDCGLVHDVCLTSDRKGNIGMAVQRNKRATSARRRYLRSG